MLLLLAALGCSTPVPPAPPVPASQPLDLPATPVWPEAGAVHPVALPQGGAPPGVLIDAGHGAPGNSGNTSARCAAEQDEMLRIQDDVVARLRALGWTDVLVGREGAAQPSYRARTTRAEEAGVPLIQLHSDARGSGTVIAQDPPDVCVSNPDAPGFSVLWSDEGEAGLVAERLRLARAVARRMAEAGFLPYDGADYETLYEGDVVPGVFVDRHAPSQRIFMLRRPTVPSILIETHHAWDEAEVARWQEPETLEAFATAVAAALLDLEAAGGP